MNGGTSIFEDHCYLDATGEGGSAVSLTYMGGPVGIDEVEAEQPVKDGRIYSLDGRLLGTSVPADFRGIYIQNGVKYVKMR